MSSRQGFTLAKAQASECGPLLRVHGQNLRLHGNVGAEVFRDAAALRKLVWDAALYDAVSALKPHRGPTVRVEGAKSAYAVAGALEYLRQHAFPVGGDDDADAVRELAKIGDVTGKGTVQEDALFNFYDALRGLAPLAIGSSMTILITALVQRLTRTTGKKRNLEVQMTLHYLTRTIFTIGMVPDVSQEFPTFEMLPLARFILSDPRWELGLPKLTADRSLTEIANAAIEARTEVDVPGVIVVPDIRVLIQDHRAERRMARATDDLCATVESRAREAADVARGARVVNGRTFARTLATRDANATNCRLDNDTAKARFLLVRILKPLWVGVFNAFDGTFATEYTPLSVRQLKMISVDARGTAAELAQLQQSGAVRVSSPLEEAHALMTRKGATYILLATDDPDLTLKDRMWLRGEGTACESLSGHAYEMGSSKDEVLRLVRKSDGKVVSAAGRAFAQRVGENVLLVVYS